MRYKSHPITAPIQLANIKHSFKIIKGTIKMGTMYVTLELQPTSFSVKYKVSIKYNIGHSPIVKVVAPTLIIPENKMIIHMYSDSSLCLYYPKNKEWNNNMLIARTTIPWTVEWLYYYENWVITGEWLGEGVHPTIDKQL